MKLGRESFGVKKRANLPLESAFTFIRKSALKRLVSNCLFWFGLGVLVHDYAHTLWQIGGYAEIIAPQGGWIGLALLLAGWVLQRVLPKPGNPQKP